MCNDICENEERVNFTKWANMYGQELKPISVKYFNQKPSTIDVLCGYLDATGEVRVYNDGNFVCSHRKVKEAVSDEFIFVIATAMSRNTTLQDIYNSMIQWVDISYRIGFNVLLFGERVFIKVFNFTKFHFLLKSNYTHYLSDCFELTKNGETLVIDSFDLKKFEELWELKDKKPVEVQASKEWSKGDEPVHIFKVIRDFFIY